MSAFFIIFAVERRACLHQPLKDGKSRFLSMGWQIYYIERPNDRFRLNKKKNMTVTYKKKDQTNKH